MITSIATHLNFIFEIKENKVNFFKRCHYLLFEEGQIFPTNQLQPIHNTNQRQIEFVAAIELTGAFKTLSQTLSVKIALNIIVPIMKPIVIIAQPELLFSLAINFKN